MGCPTEQFQTSSSSVFSNRAKRMSSSHTNKIDVGKLKYRGFKPGSIIRVKMMNFLTYDECEVFPGPKLNVVIGPNGTGKSTLTHAICLACCGSTSDVGRSNDLSSFVKHGKENMESFVEVDILTDDSWTTIRRIIHSNTKKSNWILDGKHSTQAAVKNVMVKYSIDVDNLCSFMPQDKVGNFSRFTHKEMLQNTLQSVTNRTAEGKCLHEEQMELSNMEKSKDEYRRTKIAKETRVSQLQKEFAHLEAEVEKLRQREQFQETLDLCTIKQVNMEVEEHQAAVNEKEVLKVAAERRLSTETKKLGPLEARERDLTRQQASRDKAVEGVRTKSRNLINAITANKECLDSVELKLIDSAALLDNIARDRLVLEQRVFQESNILHTKEREHAEAEALMPGLVVKMRSNDEAMEHCQLKVRELEEHSKKINDDLKNSQSEIQDFTRQLAGLQDSREVFKQHLRKFADVRGLPYEIKSQYAEGVTAMEHFERHEAEWRAKGQLTGEVFGPIGLYMDVADKACSTIFERVVSLNKLLGYIACSDDDADFLKHQFRNVMDLKIDIYTQKNPEISQTHQWSPAQYAHINSRAEVKGYLSDFVVCHDIVRSFLHMNCGVHNILWARHLPDTVNVDLNAFCPQNIKEFRFYLHETPNIRSDKGGDVTEYSGRKSRYAIHNAPSTSISQCAPRNTLISLQHGSEDITERRALLESNILNLRKQQSAMNNTSKGILEEKAAAQSELAALMAEKSNLVQGKKFPAQCLAQINKQKDKIADIQRALSTDSVAEKKRKTADYVRTVTHFLDCVEAQAKAGRDLMEHEAEQAAVLGSQSDLREQIRNVDDQLTLMKNELVNLQRDLAEAKKIRDGTQRGLDEVKVSRNELVVKFGGRAAFDLKAQQAQEQIAEDTKAALQTRIGQVNAQLVMLMDNPNLVARHKKCHAELLAMQEELRTASELLENAEEGIQQRMVTWVETVEEITATLSERFNRYMSELQYSGKVVFTHQDTIDKYELVIWVRFRENEQIEKLEGRKHSGGERAVSTVMFLMALQDMASSPFRVVDEINQGMDERNERLVFDRIIKECCGPTKPQYFLATPKLLQGLRAMDNKYVTVLIVLNGHGVVSKYMFSQLLREYRAPNGDHYVSEDEDEVEAERQAAARLQPAKPSDHVVEDDEDDEYYVPKTKNTKKRVAQEGSSSSSNSRSYKQITDIRALSEDEEEEEEEEY